MRLIYAQEELPKKRTLKIGSSVFLAGPTPRTDNVPSWRPEMVEALKTLGPAVVNEVLIPEPRDGVWQQSYHNQVEWEYAAIDYCDILLFWVPRDIENGMPGFTTNVEFGLWLREKSKVLLGYPPGADKCRYLGWLYKKILGRNAVSTIEELVHELRDIHHGAKSKTQR